MDFAIIELSMSADLNDLTVQSITHQIPSLYSESLDFLKKMIRENGIHTVLEIGSANARTAIELAAAFDHLQVITIERDPEMIRLARQNIRESGLSDRIRLIEGDAQEEAVRDLVKENVDLIFIDGAKSKYQVFFELYTPLLAENGWVVSDNMFFHGLAFHPWSSPNRRTRSLMKRLLAYHAYLEDHPDFETQWLDIGDGIACSRRKQKC